MLAQADVGDALLGQAGDRANPLVERGIWQFLGVVRQGCWKGIEEGEARLDRQVQLAVDNVIWAAIGSGPLACDDSEQCAVPVRTDEAGIHKQGAERALRRHLSLRGHRCPPRMDQVGALPNSKTPYNDDRITTGGIYP